MHSLSGGIEAALRTLMGAQAHGSALMLRCWFDVRLTPEGL